MERTMRELHLWISGAAHATLAAATACEPTVTVDCHRRLRGPYTGTGSLMRALVPALRAGSLELARRHAIEILAVAPELEPLTGPAPETLTSLASPKERTRWYSRYRTRRIAHGITDFLRDWPGEDRLTLAFCSAGLADPTDLEFLSIAVRRLDPARVRLIICADRETPELEAAVAAYTRREKVATTGSSAPTRTSADELAAAFVASDGLSDVEAERDAYLRADPRLRAQLHDKRAEELMDRGGWSLCLGAIPYHLEHGSSPVTTGRKACEMALNYCIGMGYYHAGLELARMLARVTGLDADPGTHYTVNTLMCQCLAGLERPAETEPIYYGVLSRSSSPRHHMSISYALAMLYTRLYDSDHKDHRKALAHINTAVAIAGLLEDPADRAFHSVFMNNGKSLVEMHLGNITEALELVTAGIRRLDRELPHGEHRLHRSVLHHNRAQVLAALGRPEEALADFDHVIEVDPNYAEYYFDRGNLLCKTGRFSEAVSAYDAAIRLTPPFPELFYNRGDARAAAGDIEGAMADFRYVLDLEPDYLEGRVSLAALLLDTGDPEAAAAQAREGLGLTPGEARLHCTLGLALLDLHHGEEAHEAFSRALDLDPGSAEALANRAVAAYECGHYDAAVADLTTALAVSPGDPDLLSNRGLAHEAAGRHERAIFDYDLALRDERADRATLLSQRDRCYAALADGTGMITLADHKR
jgi:tetratricopeptide (TPR) repeat protein